MNTELPATITPRVLSFLTDLLGPRLSTAMDERTAHATRLTYHKQMPPELVVFPESVTEIGKIVAFCNKNRIPVIPYGAGTSFEGQLAAVTGGISLDLRLLNKIHKINTKDGQATVQSGVKRSLLDMALAATPFFFPAGPGVDASIGGMVSTRASGTNAVRYGTIRENVMALEVVLVDGTVMKTGSKARKSSTGYDLTHLFTGAEGTLGIITEVTLKLHPRPAQTLTIICSFRDLDAAVNSVVEILQTTIPVAQIELLDQPMVQAMNRYSDLQLPELPTLFIELHGEENNIKKHAEDLNKIAAKHGMQYSRCPMSLTHRKQLWQARIDAAPATLSLRPGAQIMSTDACVPISQLAHNIRMAQSDIRKSRLIAPIIGHVGDGNFHLAILIKGDNADELARARALNDAIVSRALSSGGTCSGEHGIGIGKLRYMEKEHGPALNVMRMIKKTMDPNGILNPGKLIPPKLLKQRRNT